MTTPSSSAPTRRATLGREHRRFAAAARTRVGTLLSRGYRATTFTRAVLDPPSLRTLAVTFDDAYRSVLELARPVLDELGVVASVYVPTDFAGQATPMTWPGIDMWLGGPHEHELLRSAGMSSASSPTVAGRWARTPDRIRT